MSLAIARPLCYDNLTMMRRVKAINYSITLSARC